MGMMGGGGGLSGGSGGNSVPGFTEVDEVRMASSDSLYISCYFSC